MKGKKRILKLMDSDQHIKWIDVAKGIAMICVVIGHINGGKFSEEVNLGFVYSFHLTAFFVLSGYVLKIVPITRNYFNKKFARLMKPYLYTCIAVTIMDIFNACFLQKDASTINITAWLGKDILRSIIASGDKTNIIGVEAGNRIGAIWFLPAMFFALIIVQIVLQ